MSRERLMTSRLQTIFSSGTTDRALDQTHATPGGHHLHRLGERLDGNNTSLAALNGQVSFYGAVEQNTGISGRYSKGPSITVYETGSAFIQTLSALANVWGRLKVGQMSGMIADRARQIAPRVMATSTAAVHIDELVSGQIEADSHASVFVSSHGAQAHFVLRGSSALVLPRESHVPHGVDPRQVHILASEPPALRDWRARLPVGSFEGFAIEQRNRSDQCVIPTVNAQGLDGLSPHAVFERLIAVDESNGRIDDSWVYTGLRPPVAQEYRA